MSPSRLRTAAAALALALLTAVPVASAHRAPPPQLGDPVLVERTPRAPTAGPSARPYEDGSWRETSSPPPGRPRQAEPPTATGPSGDVSRVPEPPPTRLPATPQSRSSLEAEPVPPPAPLPATSSHTATPAPTGSPSYGSARGDDGRDGDDDGGDDG
ncbi:hypothetical protein [Streptomyces sp. 7N604]|uniref:hypothetical protein n=1 Tax=Streptomyces sp. 7N604 TaxID=3457415 RepID=UPI003FD32DCC